MQKNSAEIGIAIVGCGYWGVNYIRVFNELPNAKVVVVCDQRVERLQEIKRRFPDVQVTTELDRALEIASVTAVVICTGATTHFAVASCCLAAGKHVLIEKPMATNIEDIKVLSRLADSKQLALMVGHTFLYNAGIRKLKEYITQAEIGQIYYLYARRTNLGPIRQDVNSAWDLAPHDVSIFNYLLDSTPLWVSAVGANVLHNPQQDVSFVSLGYQNNIIAHIHVSWVEPNKVREVVVVGGNSRIVFDDLNTTERVKIYKKGISAKTTEATNYGEHQLQICDGEIISPPIETSEPLKNQCNHFLESISQGKRPLTDARAGLEVVKVLIAIDRSIEQNGAPVWIEQEKPHTLPHYNGIGVNSLEINGTGINGQNGNHVGVNTH